MADIIPNLIYWLSTTIILFFALCYALKAMLFIIMKIKQKIRRIKRKFTNFNLNKR